MPSAALLDFTLKGGSLWSGLLGRGKRLRFTDLEGGANVGLLLYNARERHERYNMPDTLKGQHVFYLRAPYCLHSDMGRLMASITEDSVGWHDTVCGHSTAAMVRKKYGERSYQQMRNEFFRDARSCFLIELAKWGLGHRDLMPNVNLFSQVVADDTGTLRHVPGHSAAGGVVELRMEMDCVVVLTTCQHPLDETPIYDPKPVRIQVIPGVPAGPDDPSLAVRPENRRAWENTCRYFDLQS
ncbi:MAG: urea amidolyase associated protein UAAP1 [Verrucomicrobiales bacterium]